MSAQWVAVPILFLSIGLSLGYLFCGPSVEARHPFALLAGSDLLRCAATGLIPVFLSSGRLHIVALSAACLVNGTMAAVSQTALASLWAEIAPAGKLRETLATNALLNRTGLAVGGGVGGVMAGAGWFAIALWVDAGTFLLSALLWFALLVIGVVDVPTPVRQQVSQSNPVSEIRASVRLLSSTPWLLRYFLLTAIASVPGQIAGTTAGPAALASMSSIELAIWAAAPSWMLLAGNAAARMVRRIPRPGLVLVASQALMPLGQALTVASSTAGGAIVLSSSGRFLEAVSQPSLNAFIGQEFPAGERARVYALTRGANSILAPIGLVATYWLLGDFSTGAVLVISAATCASLVLLSLFSPGMTQMESSHKTKLEDLS